MISYHKILYSSGGGVARITLNRPEKRNALDEELIGEIAGALAVSANDDGARVVLITGAGKDFCSGADLSELRRVQDASVADNLAGARHLAELFLAMRRHPRPIVSAVRGRALAGGCGLATACDLILASESAKFGYPEVNIGFVPAMVMAILRRSVSEKQAFELITTGAILDAGAARAAGMVNQVYPDAEFESAVDQYVSHLAAKPPAAISLAKSLLYHMDGLTFESALEAGVHANTLARMTSECRQGVEKFLAAKNRE